MNKFKTLFMMQLREKIDLSFLKSKKQTLFKAIFSIVGFVAICVISYLVLWLCQMLNIFSAINHIPLSVMAVVFFVIFILSLCTCTLGLSKTLYYAKDNQVLLTYPVNANSLFLSKILVYYISEVKRNFSFVIPIFFAYGLLSQLPFMYFIWFPVMITIFTAIPVLLGALLSFPIYYLLRFLNKFSIIKIALLIIILAGIITGAVLLINAIPENINLIESWAAVSRALRDFLSWFADKFYVFYALIIFFCGKYENLYSILFTEYSYIVLFVILGIIAVLVGLNYLISRPLYLKMASKHFEFDSKKSKSSKNKAYKKGISPYIYETKKTLRDSKVLVTSIATLIIAPTAILLLNAIYAAINTRLMGDYFTMTFNMLVIMLFVLAHNISASYIYSKEGESFYLNKTKPNKPFKLLVPYLAYYGVMSVLILIASTTIFLMNANTSAINGVLIFFAMLFVVLGHIVWSAELDFLNPKNALYRMEGAVSVNTNEVKSTILAFALCIIFFAITLFFLIDGMSGVFVKLFVLSFMFFALRIYLFYYKTKVLFKEI